MAALTMNDPVCFPLGILIFLLLVATIILGGIIIAHLFLAFIGRVFNRAVDGRQDGDN